MSRVKSTDRPEVTFFRSVVVTMFIMIAVTIGLAACSSEGHEDAPVQQRDTSGATVQNMPDTFGNLAYKCLGNTGYLVVVVSHNLNDTPPTLVPHPTCPGYRPDLRAPGAPQPVLTAPPKDDE